MSSPFSKVTAASALRVLLLCIALLADSPLALAEAESESDSCPTSAVNMAAASLPVRAAAALMPVLGVRAAKTAYPTGDKNFAVKQGFPGAFTAEEADPFLMLDHFGPMLSTGTLSGDAYPVAWHPHRGFDILTYMVEGTGRHADSLGNRGTFESPGMQWCSTGSGIEHAEAGGTPAGTHQLGFQIWVNVPSARKMDDPRYGTEGPERIPTLVDSLAPGVTARVLAGQAPGAGNEHLRGPFRTVQSVSMIDLVLGANAALPELLIEAAHDNVLLYCYRGAGTVSGHAVPRAHIVRLDASAADGARALSIAAGAEGMSLILFAGTRLKQPIAWHGPFVMTTQAEIEHTFQEYRQVLNAPPRCNSIRHRCDFVYSLP